MKSKQHVELVAIVSKEAGRPTSMVEWNDQWLIFLYMIFCFAVTS